MIKPIIGITPDRSDTAENIEAHFFVRRNYCAAIVQSGGIPIILPYDMDSVDAYLDIVDGIVLTGGMFDIDPAAYGMPAKHPGHMTLKEDRTDFEQAILRGAMARNLPVLGICGGMQLIAVEMGAKLIQHIPSDVDTLTEHKQGEPCNIGTHRIHVSCGTLLHRILRIDERDVNSLHHQAVMQESLHLRAGAFATDGIIESVEATDKKFCIGVQWHPEYLAHPSDRNIFAALVKAAKDATT